jgi:hypothetical protein
MTITTQTVRTASGATRTDIYRDDQIVGYVGHLPDSRGFVAFTATHDQIGCFTDFTDAQRAVDQAGRPIFATRQGA